jgi:hypothetical protein
MTLFLQILRKCAITLTVFLFAAIFTAGPFRASSFAATVDEAEEERLESFDFSYDMRSMIQMNPDFSTYPGTDGVIWLKKLNYSPAPDGGIEKRSQWILLGRRGLNPRWLEWNIPIPPGGEAEILEASVHSPGSAVKIMDAWEIAQKGDTVRTAIFSNLPEEFILVISWKEIFPDRLTVEDLVRTSDSLPVWEQIIGVVVPAGHPFYIASSPEVQPREEEVDGRRVCEWRIINVAAKNLRTPRAGSHDYIAFGTRESRPVAARVLKTLSSVAIPSISDARDFRGKQPDAKSIESFLRRIYEEPELTLQDALREIPDRAPWTKREKLLLAYKGLQESGGNVRLLWRMAWQPGKNQPVCEAMASPVLEIFPPDPKKDSFYCDMEYPPVFGENSIFLQGKILSGLTPDGDIEERRVPASNAAENRLNAVFDLRLSEEGILSGIIRLQARNAWRHLLMPANLSSGDIAPLMASLFPQALRYSDVAIRTRGNESELLVTLSGIQAIRGTGGSGGNILVSLPALIPNWFGDPVKSGKEPATLHFPFLMDAKITMTLPSSTMNVMLPAPVDRNMGKVKYTDSYRLSKKRTLTAEAHMTVATTALEDVTAANLDIALQGWRMFMTKNFPVRLNLKK